MGEVQLNLVRINLSSNVLVGFQRSEKFMLHFLLLYAHFYVTLSNVSWMLVTFSHILGRSLVFEICALCPACEGFCMSML